MLRRSALQALLALGAPPALSSLSGCGGGGGDEPDGPRIQQFTSDKARYLIGERPMLTAVFSGGIGELMPGSVPVQSGVPLPWPTPLSESREIALVVRTPEGARATRVMQLPVDYRNRLRTLAMGFTRAAHATATADDGRLLIVSGEFLDPESGRYHISNEVRAFDPQAETFSLVGHLISARVGLTATTLPTDRVLVLGAGTLQAAPAAELFDPLTGMSVAAGISTRRHLHTATLLGGGLVLLTGGVTASGQPSAELYDPFTDTTTALAGLNVARAGHSALRLADGRVLIHGGSGMTVGSVPPPELYDPATRSFTLLPAVDPAGRANHACLHSAGGSVYVIGGEDVIEGEPMRSTLRINGTSAQTAPAMRVARNLPRATAMSDGRIWVAGGNSAVGFQAEASTEILAADGSAWTAGPTMAFARAHHTVDRLVTGKLLVIGGNDSGTQVLSTAELYD